MKLNITTLLALAALSTLNSQLSTLHAQGSLTPPAGAPAPVMKSLDQIEPRTPVEPGQPGVLFTNGAYQIVKPGNYFLTGSITGVVGQVGICLYADDITLDLNGFSLIGVPGSLQGITDSEEMGGNRYRIINGTIRNWSKDGIYLNAPDGTIESVKVTSCGESGILCYGPNTRIYGCSVAGVKLNGIRCGGSALVSNCHVQLVNTSGASYGIEVDSGRVLGCSVASISGSVIARGIELSYSGSVEDCSVETVTSVSGDVCGISAPIVKNCRVNQVLSITGPSSGISGNAVDGIIAQCAVNYIQGAPAFGINVSSNRYLLQNSKISSITGTGGSTAGIYTTSFIGSSLIQGCDVSSVTNSGGNLGWGILLHRGQAQDCNISRTKNHGIYANSLTSVINCRISEAGLSGDGAGIFVSSSANRVEGNFVSSSSNGIQIGGNSTAVVIRNVCSGNSTNYSISAGNVTPIVTGASMASATNPLANVSY